VSIKRIGYLDGVRGLAAMQVVFGHYAHAFAPDWVNPLGYFADGDSAVLLFFLMSGLVLTPSFERTPNAIVTGLVRRIVRLGLPLAAAVLFAFVLQTSLPGWSAAVVQKTGFEWLSHDHVSADPMRAIADLSGLTMLTGHSDTTLFGILSNWLPGLSTATDVPIWSLHIEFWGSALVLGLVWARANSNPLYSAVLCACIVLIGNNALVLFMLGHLSAILVRVAQDRRWGERPGISLAAFALLAAGIWVCEDSKVEHYLQHYIPGIWRFEYVATFGNIFAQFAWFRPIVMIGTTMAYTGILLLPPAHKLCSMRVPAWLGRMSFPIYLLHWPVMMTIGSMTFLFVSPLGQPAAAITALLVGLVVTLPLAILFERFVDQPAIALSRSFGRLVPVKVAQRT
jgi:peptidoglycan/LPS O-acetylase OafA/YrhL